MIFFQEHLNEILEKLDVLHGNIVWVIVTKTSTSKLFMISKEIILLIVELHKISIKIANFKKDQKKNVLLRLKKQHAVEEQSDTNTTDRWKSMNNSFKYLKGKTGC